ncbi:MAG: rplI [Candidatus Taylorbacteria bacterium]|nr:rplI [Candidatus Taylorbacteria bacterium]
MKVILLKDVQKIGKKFDIKNVADGFALNSLIPTGKAKVATDAEIKKVEALKKVIEAEKKIQMDLLTKNINEINEKQVTIKAKANSKGSLFAQLHTEDIVKAIKESIGADIHPDFIILPKPIKEAGEHDLQVKVGDKKVTIKLIVEGTK